MPTILRTALAASLLAAPLDRAAEGGSQGRSLLDAYLATAAATQPEFRADVRAGTRSAIPDSGRQAGCGPRLGPFTYRAKRFIELSPRERGDLLRAPRLRAYLLAARPRAEPAKAAAPIRRFSIPPAEMLNRRPFAATAQ